MNLYFNGTCDNRISRIDFTSLCLKTKDDSDIDVNMDETDIAVENGKISVRMKGIAFDNEYANGRGNLLENGTLVVNLAIDEADGRFFEDEKAWTKEDQAFYETLLHSVQLKNVIVEDATPNGVNRYEIPVTLERESDCMEDCSDGTEYRWTEIRDNYVNDEGFLCIDAWETDDGDEEGNVIAYVDTLSGRVIYTDPLARVDQAAQEIINGMSEQYKKEHPYDVETLEAIIHGVVSFAGDQPSKDGYNLLNEMGFTDEQMKFFGFDVDAVSEKEE